MKPEKLSTRGRAAVRSKDKGDRDSARGLLLARLGGKGPARTMTGIEARSKATRIER